MKNALHPAAFRKTSPISPRSFRKHAKPGKLRLAKKLRSRPTSAERILWSRLRDYKTGFRFRTQAIILGWIVDFYCPKSCLVVELDGPYHSAPDQAALDLIRDHTMRSRGFRILRFSNQQVFQNLNSVLAQIKAACNVDWFFSGGKPPAVGYEAAVVTH